MRTACWIGACLGLLATALDARAQSLETQWGVTTIVAPQVEAWSGPNQEKNYPTNLLTQSQQVSVKCDKTGRPIIIPDINEKHPGWLEIKPPQGSYSWIHQRFIKKQISGNTWVVESESPVGIYVGSQRVPDEPKVERVQLSKGTQVVVVDTPVASKSGGYYYPIASPENEPRYIPANAINKAQVTVGAPQASRPGGVAQVSGSVPVAGATGSYADLFARADTAERLGKTADAKALFEQARQATKDPQEQLRCQNRIDYLQRAGTATAGGWNIGNRTVAGTTALYTSPGPRALVPGQRQWTDWGILQRATNLPSVDGQEVFRLVDAKGAPIAYATAQPGFTLSSYVGRFLTLYGLVSMSPDDSMRLMRISVQHVSLKQ